MLTVKWITKHMYGEIERIFEAKEVLVAFRDASAGVGHWKVADRSVEVAGLILDPYEGLQGKYITEGKAYVMNEHGATVGSYVLSTRVFMDKDEDGFPLADNDFSGRQLTGQPLQQVAS